MDEQWSAARAARNLRRRLTVDVRRFARWGGAIPRPWWRWWLFCAALALSWRVSWKWPPRLMNWAVLPEWVGFQAGTAHRPGGGEETPW